MGYGAAIFGAIFSVIFGFSACASGVPDNLALNLPQVKNIKALSDVSSAAFEWDVIYDSAVSGYAVYRNEGEGFSHIKTLKNPLASHFVDEGLSPEKEYSYFFYTLGRDAQNNEAHSPKSETITLKTGFIEPIANLYASNDYPKKVKLLWQPHANKAVSHYLIQRQDINGEFKTIAIAHNRLATEYIDEKLEDSGTYKYRVVAMTFDDAPSRPSKAITASTKKKPKPIPRLSATLDKREQINLAWDALPDAKAYKIYRANKADGNFQILATSATVGFSDYVKENGARYFYKVSSLDASDIESELSAAALGSTRTPPSAPNITKGFVSENVVQIHWQAVGGAAHYAVYRTSGVFGEKLNFKVYENFFIDKDAKIGQDYSYAVAAVDEMGLESPKSQTITLSIK